MTEVHWLALANRAVAGWQNDPIKSVDPVDDSPAVDLIGRLLLTQPTQQHSLALGKAADPIASGGRGGRQQPSEPRLRSIVTTTPQWNSAAAVACPSSGGSPLLVWEGTSTSFPRPVSWSNPTAGLRIHSASSTFPPLRLFSLPKSTTIHCFQAPHGRIESSALRCRCEQIASFFFPLRFQFFPVCFYFPSFSSNRRSPQECFSRWRPGNDESTGDEEVCVPRIAHSNSNRIRLSYGALPDAEPPSGSAAYRLVHSANDPRI